MVRHHNESQRIGVAGDGCIVEASGGKASLFVLRKYSGARCSNHRNEINMVGQRNPANAKAITLRTGGLGHGKIVCLPIGLRELFFEYGNPILIEGARFIGRWVWLASCGSPIYRAMGLAATLSRNKLRSHKTSPHKTSSHKTRFPPQRIRSSCGNPDLIVGARFIGRWVWLHPLSRNKLRSHKTSSHKTSSHKTSSHKTSSHKTSSHKTSSHKTRFPHHCTPTSGLGSDFSSKRTSPGRLPISCSCQPCCCAQRAAW